MSIVISTLDTAPQPGTEIIGLVSASCCFSKSMIGDVVANVKNWTVGGELNAYSKLLDRAMELVIERITENAVSKGATGIIGFRVCTSQVAEGAAELVAYGTAIRVSS